MGVGVFSLLQLGPRIQSWDPILGIGTMRLAARGAGRSCAASHGQHSAITATMPAAFATRRSICRKSKRPPVASASVPLNSASNSAAGQILVSHYHQKPSGSTKGAMKGYVIKSKRSKPKPTEHASASRSIFAPSLITSQSCAVIEFLRIEPSLGPDQGNQQHLITTAFGSPSEACDLPGGP